ncbi:hypothetical protein E2986_01163, partial [Frieseomelitta varia]
QGRQNAAFIGDDGHATTDFQRPATGDDEKFRDNNSSLDFSYGTQHDRKFPLSLSLSEGTTVAESQTERDTWGNGLEFLMSCIAMSIGLGNVWRFPFTAYENGGGVFLIPYIIVLFLVGKPFYYLEMIMGQFCSRSSVKIWSAAPGFRGVGWAQMFSMLSVGTYYCFLMSITLYYLVASFQSPLPWSTCLQEWGNFCADSGGSYNVSKQNSTNMTMSSAELYFKKIVLKEKQSIDDGIGLPDWSLTICLFVAWACIFAVLARGVKSSGKAAYFLAIFPYIIMISLLVRAVTLEGAVNGIIFFIKPNWKKLFEAHVWYAAVTQCFFSLSVCFGGVIMYSSYNDFRHNIYRDVIVVTTLDTFTSLMAGFTIFGILGNLAHKLGIEDVSNVVRGGTGLAFVSYPDAIAKFTVLPQFFSVLFFLMLYVLGIGSAIALAGALITIISDQFPNLRHIYIVIGTVTFGFLAGIIYCTPGGQFMLELVDFYAGSFVVFILATLEITGIFWVYGLENFLDDVEYMLKKRPSAYWRVCWAIVVPLLLAMIKSAFVPSPDWGPKNPKELASWREFKETRRKLREKRDCSRIKQFVYVMLCWEDKLI